MKGLSSLILVAMVMAATAVTTSARADPVDIYASSGVGDSYDWVSGWGSGRDLVPAQVSTNLWFYQSKNDDDGRLNFQARFETEFVPEDNAPPRLLESLRAGHTLGGNVHYQYSQVTCGEAVCEFDTPFSLGGSITAGLWPEDGEGWLSVYATTNELAHIDDVSADVYESEFGDPYGFFHRTFASIVVNGYVAAGNYRIVSVPEPATLALLGVGGLVGLRRKMRELAI